MGRLTGYSLVSFRIGRVKLHRKEGKRTLTLEQIPGTLGQCVMLPEERDAPENVPQVLYHFGGGLFNLLTALISVPFFFLSAQRYVKVLFLMLGVLSLALALLNLTPVKITVPNDGYNIRLVLTSPDDRRAMYHILQIMGHPEQSAGEMPENYIEYNEQGEYAATMKYLCGLRHLDRLELQKAEKRFKEAVETSPAGMAYYRLEAKKELLFCLLVQGAGSEEISDIYDDELKHYIDQNKKSTVRCLRVSCACGYCIRHDQKTADEEYLKAMNSLGRLSEGDAKMERRLLNLLKETYGLSS